jgi:transcription termination factor NusA
MKATRKPIEVEYEVYEEGSQMHKHPAFCGTSHRGRPLINRKGKAIEIEVGHRIISIGDSYDVLTEEEFAEQYDSEQKSFDITGLDDRAVPLLIEAGFTSVEDVANANRDDLIKIEYITDKNVDMLQDNARNAL